MKTKACEIVSQPLRKAKKKKTKQKGSSNFGSLLGPPIGPSQFTDGP